MKRLLLALHVLLVTSMSAQAQGEPERVRQIRKMYADAKEQIARNGKEGMAPLDLKIVVNNAEEVSEDFSLDNTTELTFYFNKFRINSELDYPDASSCYFVTENWTSNGHLRYREVFFDPNEGTLLFSYMHGETDAGFVVESRYYYDSEEKLIWQQHKVGGEVATPNAHDWTTPEGDKELAQHYMEIFDELMNYKHQPAAEATVGSQRATSPLAKRLSFIRTNYAQSKEKAAENLKSDTPHNIQIVVRDQTWGPPQTIETSLYFDKSCYLITEHNHHNDMGPDSYSEYLFAPQSTDLIFSYTCAQEEGQKFEWRYYYDENGKCIEVKSDMEEHDSGAADKKTARRYLDIFKKLLDLAV